MTEPITIKTLKLSGFRAYLKPKTFTLHRKKTPLSLAVFAPNAKGKSSLVDSLEYYFSENGTLERLGQRQSTTKTGSGAIRHVDAKKKNVDTFVHIKFNLGDKEFGDKRQFPNQRPDVAKIILDRTKASFIIRGYELRKFIDGVSPTDQYQELVVWFGLKPLLQLQKNLKKLKQQIHQKVADTTDYKERLRDIASITNNTLTVWDESDILVWVNENVLTKLNKPLQLKELSSDDPTFAELNSLMQMDQKRTGLETLEKLLTVIKEIWVQPVTGQDNPTGHINLFEKSVIIFNEAFDAESKIRSTTSEFMFNDLWEKTKNMLEDNIKLDKCPVCGTEFSKSPGGSHDAVYATLCVNISKLKECQQAESAKKDARDKLDYSVNTLGEALKNLELLGGSEYKYDAISAYHKALQSWKIEDVVPDNKEVTINLTRLHALVSADIKKIKQSQVMHANDAFATIERLLEIKAELERIELTKTKMQSISASLDKQIETFDITIVNHIQNLVSELEDNIRLLYQSIKDVMPMCPTCR